MGPGRLRNPTDLAFGPRRAVLYVVDASNARVVGYSPAGEPVLTLGEGELERPHGIAVGADGAVYVTDIRRHQVLQFVQGELVAAYGARGIERMHFLKPRGIGFDGRGDLMEIENANHRGTIFGISVTRGVGQP